MTIHTNLQSVNLDDCYLLLCIEEINMEAKLNKETSTQNIHEQQFALIVTGRDRGRSYFKFYSQG